MHAEEISDKYHDPESSCRLFKFMTAAKVVRATANTLWVGWMLPVEKFRIKLGRRGQQENRILYERLNCCFHPLKRSAAKINFGSENYFGGAQKQDHLSDNQREKTLLGSGGGLAVHLNTPRRTSHEISYHGIMMVVRACNLWGRWKWSSPWKRRRLWNRLAEKLLQSPSVMRLKGCLPLSCSGSMQRINQTSSLSLSLSLERSLASR